MGRGREEGRAHCRRSVSLKRGLTQEPLSQDGSGGDICDCVTLICERAERESRERQPIDARHACTILSGACDAVSCDLVLVPVPGLNAGTDIRHRRVTRSNPTCYNNMCDVRSQFFPRRLQLVMQTRRAGDGR